MRSYLSFLCVVLIPLTISAKQIPASAKQVLASKPSTNSTAAPKPGSISRPITFSTEVLAVVARAELGHFGRWAPIDEKVLARILSDEEVKSLPAFVRLKYARQWALRETEAQTIRAILASDKLVDDLQKYWSSHALGSEATRRAFIKRSVEADLRKVMFYREKQREQGPLVADSHTR